MTNIVEINAKYFGGHSQYKRRKKVRIILDNTKISIPELPLQIPYKSVNNVIVIKQASLRKRGLWEMVDIVSGLLMFSIYIGIVIWDRRKECLQISYDDKNGLEELLNFQMKNLQENKKTILNHVIQGKQQTEPQETPRPKKPFQKKPIPQITIAAPTLLKNPQLERPPQQEPGAVPPQQYNTLVPGKRYQLTEIQEHIDELKEMENQGTISNNEYARRTQIVFIDGSGQKWRIGSTGNWYVYVGDSWSFGTPPDHLIFQ